METKIAYFWRRLVAIIIDWTLFSLIFAVLASLIFAAIPNVKPNVPSFITTTVCGPVNLPRKYDAKFAEMRSLPEPAGIRVTETQYDSVLCNRTNNFIITTELLTLRRLYQGSNGQFRFFDTTLAVNKNLDPVLLLDLTFIAFALFVLFSALSSAAFGRTIGKKVVGLRIKSVDAGRPRLNQALTRESVKMLPYLLISVFSLYGSIQFSPISIDEIQLATQLGGRQSAVVPMILALIAILILVFYLFSLGKFKQTPYDHLANTYIEKT